VTVFPNSVKQKILFVWLSRITGYIFTFEQIFYHSNQVSTCQTNTYYLKEIVEKLVF